MAVGKRDVELVIRARDEAAKTIDAVGKALQGLVGQQEATSASASKVEGSLGRITNALGGLDKALRGVSIGQKLAAETDKATAAMTRLEEESSKTAAEAIKLGKAAAQAAQDYTKLKAEAENLSGSLQRQKGVVESTAASQSKLVQALRAATNERDKLATADKNGATALAAQEARVAAATEKYERLAQAVLAAEAPSKRLQTSFETATAAMERQQQKLAALQAAQTGIRESLTTSAAAVERFGTALAKTEVDLGKAKAELAGTASSLKQVEGAVKSAATNQGQLEKAARDTTAALKTQEAEVTEARAALAALEANTKGVTAAQAALANAVRGGLLKAFGEQKAALDQARVDLEAAGAATKKLALELRATAEPTAAMVASFEKSRVAARAAQDAYTAQVLALQKMRLELRAAGMDYDALVAAEQRIVGVTRTAAASLEVAGRAAKEAAAGLKQLDAAGSGTGLGGLSNNANAAGAAMRRGAKDTDAFSDAFKRFYGEGRTSMSLLQRIRGEVLATIAAYAGFEAVVGGIRKVIEAYQGLEAATSRMNVAFEKGGQRQVANELDFSRRMANRLGLEFNTLAGEYSKFAIATQGTNLEGEKTRKIFMAVAEAARVQKLSLDDQKGVFLALSQMASKGRVSMEELRQQLGDRLPGAVQLMANAVGVGTAELFKMIEAGQVSSDVLDKFADELNKKFGGALAKSLSTVTTEIGKFQNNMTQALLAIGNAGAMDSFKDFLETLNKFLTSSDGAEFFKSISAAISGLFASLKFLVENIKVVTSVFAALIAIKVSGFFVALGGAVVTFLTTFRLLGAAAPVAAAAVASVGTAAAATTGAAVGAAGAVGGLRIALSALGGPVGLLLGVGTGLFAYWAMSASKATESTNDLKKATDAVMNARERAQKLGKDGLEYGKDTKFLNDQEAKRNVDALTKGLAEVKIKAAEAKQAIDGVYDINGQYSGAELQLKSLIGQYKAGAVSAEEFSTKLKAINEAAKSEEFNTIAQRALAQVEAFENAKKEIERYEASLRVAAGTATDADEKLLGLKTAVEGTGDSFSKAAEKAKEYSDAVTEIKELIPSLKKEMQELKEMEELRAKIQAAIKVYDPAGKGEVLPNDLASLLEKGMSEIRAKYDEERFKTQYETTKDSAEGQRLDELVKEVSKFAESNNISNKDLLTSFSALTNGSFKLNDAQAKAFGTDAAAPLKEQLTAVFTKLKENGLQDQDGVNRITALLAQIAAGIPEAIKAAAAMSQANGGGQAGDPVASGDANLGTIKASSEQMSRILSSTTALAAQMGVSAKNLLTIMSYETGGTFNPRQPGPRTQWGQHMGLFQAGEPQAQKYFGGDFENIERQIEGFGKYLQDAGVKAGDGLLRLYAAVNAGNANRVNASDANNGGAPGTVTDKVNTQMGGHIAKVEALMAKGGLLGVNTENQARADALLATRKAEAAEGERAAKEEEKRAERAQRGLETENARLGIAQQKAEAGKQATLEEQIQIDLAKQAEAARRGGYELTAEMIAKQREITTLKWNEVEAARQAKNEKKEETAEQQKANALSREALALSQQRTQLTTMLSQQMRAGDTEGAEATRAKLAEVNAKLLEIIPNGIAAHQAIGGAGADAAIAKLETLKGKLTSINSVMGIDLKKAGDIFVSTFTGAFDQFAQDIAAGKNVMESLRNAFLKFASDFLKQIAQMIIKQALFNALNSFFPGMGFGGKAGGVAGIFHGGGIAGSGNRSRRVAPQWFTNAARYHGGGIAGLKPGEVPAVLEQGEEILERSDPRHIFNNGKGGGPGGGAPGGSLNVKVVNAIDAGDFVAQGLSTSVGEKAILNWMRANSGAVKGAIGG